MQNLANLATTTKDMHSLFYIELGRAGPSGAAAFTGQSPQFARESNSITALVAGEDTSLPMPPMPSIHRIVYDADGTSATVELYCRGCDGGGGSRQCGACAHPGTRLLATTAGSWPGSEDAVEPNASGRWVLRPFHRTTVVNALLATSGLIVNFDAWLPHRLGSSRFACRRGGAALPERNDAHPTTEAQRRATHPRVTSTSP